MFLIHDFFYFQGKIIYRLYFFDMFEHFHHVITPGK
jgi:hypothetical protein